ncbi:transmembrane protein 268 isoform X2 [Thrips palmi]|uniref:Transmembrane protein 268 isoform X2 n=1 Tax=Thrips palmi TaxID=161013 RepID=A0A6P8Y8L1_THRPL|nr:transmembrane protein 268 isoform X2 [Thrips palmi]
MDPNPVPQPESPEPGATVPTANAKQTSSSDAKPGGWVKFEDESGSSKAEGAVVAGEAVDSTPKRVVRPRPEDFSPVPEQEHVDRTNLPVAAVISAETTHVNVSRSSVSRSPSKPVDTKIDLHTVNLRETNGTTSTNTSAGIIRQGFANGDIIVTLLPVNTRFPWITPAQFRPELVPEELMAQGLTLTVEDYVHIMELLTNDVRFHAYNICYKRILVVWILTAFIVLLSLLFSGVTGLTLFGLGVMWLVLNAAAIFLCMWVKIKLNYNLERCMAAVNKHLLRHKIILGLDDRGKLSCHKVNLCFIYFDTTDCIKKLQEVIEREEREGRPVNREETTEERRQRLQFQQRMDIEDNDIIIQGSQTTRVSRKQERGEQLLARYVQRWSKDFLRRRLDWTLDEAGGNPMNPRHLSSAQCPCQFIEEHLRNKPRHDTRACCPCWSAWLQDRGIN